MKRAQPPQCSQHWRGAGLLQMTLIYLGQCCKGTIMGVLGPRKRVRSKGTCSPCLAYGDS